MFGIFVVISTTKTVGRIPLAYLELGLLSEEVFEQDQHVGGHRGHVGGVAVWPVSVAKAGAHRVVHK